MSRPPNRPPPQAAHRDAPAVLRFEATLRRQPGVRTGTGIVLDIPEGIGRGLRAMAGVEGTLNGHPFRAALVPGPAGGLRLRVNEAMRRGARADAGDTVRVAFLGPEPDPVPPPDLQAALEASPQATALWGDLAVIGRRDWVRWIEGARTGETRARRVARTVEQLAEGKRRPCCVNVYEYMLRRVR